MSPSETPNGKAEAAISEEMLRIHRESYGHGAGRVQTHIFDGLVISVLDDVELAPSEEVLIEAGRAELVIEVRKNFQQSMHQTFTSAVERATGRSVTAFLSEIHLNPNFMIELFRLDGGEARD
ncbi:MAG: hypothetical protein QOK04_2406 [Solirubrobacteraceae bacterium]|nr:hypothetical protein [Solirubrobacteraceae bacterium]